MNILVFGKPGAGKGSVAEVFSEKSKMVHLSTGDIFRREIREKTELGLLADSYISKGQLVPDSVTNDIIRKILEKDPHNSYLFDGYPRTINQAISLDKIMNDLGMNLNDVFDLEVDDNLVIWRLTARRVCSKCGAIYNLHNHLPKVDGVCDECGSPLIQRSDDTIKEINNRLQVYKNQTKPLIDYYQKKNLLFQVDGTKDAYDVYLAIMDILHNQDTNHSGA